MFSAPGSWLTWMPGSPLFAAGYELFYRLGKEYPKPAFDIPAVNIRGTPVAVVEHAALDKPFCRLLRFKRCGDDARLVAELAQDPVTLVVAPLSGHHATLLRDAVRSLLSDHDVYITDWIDARMVPLEQGSFSLADYVAYVREFIRHIGPERMHVIAVCQPVVPVLGALALMAAAGEPVPSSVTLIGGPIDARLNPTRVNDFATSRALSWFERHFLHEVPARFPGRGRRVYPGFLQHANFIAMNPDRHITSHSNFYRHLVEGALEDVESHRRFYDEYNAVLDMDAEYYLDCVRVVFQEHLLPRGCWYVDGQRVAPEALSTPALLTIEGELDDISGPGQTQAALGLCSAIPGDRKLHLTVPGAGHYGTFSGRRWREFVYPRLREFIGAHEQR